MFRRLSLSSLLLSALVLPFTGCSSNSGLDSIAISSGAESIVAGATAQFTASGTYGSSSHLSTQDITSSVTWTSSNTGVATISASGLVTAVAAGTTTITASATGYKGPLTATASVTVTSTSSSGTGGSITTVSIIPSAQTALAVGQTVTFSAIGTTSAGATEVLTTSVTWTSSSTTVATIGASTGIATAVGPGTATITASYTNTTSGSIVTGTGTFTVTGGASTADVTALAVTPSSESLLSSSATGQLFAIGTIGGSGLQEDLTNSPHITWTSNSPAVATVKQGLVTGVGAGIATIFAEYTNPSDGSVATTSATITVTNPSATTPPAETITSLTITPSSISVLNFQLTGQFLAIGTFSQPPYVRDVTNDPNTTWISSEPEIFTVDTNSGGNAGASAGLVTAMGSGTAQILAEYAFAKSEGGDGTIQTAAATFSCPYQLPDPPNPGSCPQVGGVQPTLLQTLTVYNEGLNTTNWEVTASSATNTPDVIHCGPGWSLNGGSGGSVCTATYPTGAIVTLTAPAGAGAFGGWSYNCTPTAAITAAGPNSCTVTMTSNDTVGAIFN